MRRTDILFFTLCYTVLPMYVVGKHPMYISYIKKSEKTTAQ